MGSMGKRRYNSIIRSDKPLRQAAMLLSADGWRLDSPAGLGVVMKQQQPREAAPLWVLLALGALVVGTIAYLTGYLMIEEIVAFFR
jgi:hypothetical protein